jgi:hypothetical protein
MSEQVRALRLGGHIDAHALAAAIETVVDAVDILRFGPGGADGLATPPRTSIRPSIRQVEVHGDADERDRKSIALLRHDREIRDVQMPLRFRLIRSGIDEVVLGLAANSQWLDLRSIYIVLGAVLQAYTNRFRPDQYPVYAGPPHRPPVGVAQSRQRWWSSRIETWHKALSGLPPAPSSAVGGTARLMLDASRWADLTAIGRSGGNGGSLAVIALLSWWTAIRDASPRPLVFASTLDLRELHDLGPVIGPLTDRLVFQVDTPDLDGMTFRDLVDRAHFGILDSVVHYVSYEDLLALARRLGVPQPHRLWDVAVHYCRAPPASTNTRGEQQLAALGMSVELFRESDLAVAEPEGAAMDCHIAECGTGIALVANVDGVGVTPTQAQNMVDVLDKAVDVLVGAPDAPLSNL